MADPSRLYELPANLRVRATGAGAGAGSSADGDADVGSGGVMLGGTGIAEVLLPEAERRATARQNGFKLCQRPQRAATRARAEQRTAKRAGTNPSDLCNTALPV